MGLGMVYADGAMPTVNFDPTTGKNMTAILIDQDFFVTFALAAVQFSWSCHTNNIAQHRRHKGRYSSLPLPRWRALEKQPPQD
jgi:hypothetical protein